MGSGTLTRSLEYRVLNHQSWMKYDEVLIQKGIWMHINVSLFGFYCPERSRLFAFFG